MEILILNPEKKTNPEPRSLKAFSCNNSIIKSGRTTIAVEVQF